jgi:Ran GTPase-activating protein (RanGAP) involved in mRNA processing and transport
MPRSASDGGGNTGLFRSVFARSPLGQALTSEDSITTTLSRPQTWASRQRSDEPQRPALITMRKRSYSHRDAKRPSFSSSSKLSLHLTNDTESIIYPSVSNPEESFGLVLHHGEAQLNSAAFRRKTEYLVLTERFLVRFKTSKLAAQTFPWLLPAQAHMQRSQSQNLHDHDLSSGHESPTDLSSRKTSIVPLQEVIATEITSTDRNRLALNVITHASCHKTSNLIQVDHTGGAPHWIESISPNSRSVQEQKGNLLTPVYSQSIRDTIGPDSFSALEDSHNRLFLVHARHSKSQENISNGDDVIKDHNIVMFLLIGTLKVHLITIPKAQRSSTRSLGDLSKLQTSSYGIVSLVSASINGRDDAFDLLFRKPQQTVTSLELASVHSHRILTSLHTQLTLLQPNWKQSPYTFRVPPILQQSFVNNTHEIVPSTIDSFRLCFEAHCAAFGVDMNQIYYRLESNSDHGTTIHLEPYHRNYSILEIIAFLRGLRFNEYFNSVSLAGVSLDELAEAYDLYGDDQIVIKPRMGTDILILFEEMKHAPILFQEMTAIIMTNRQLRRLDFSHTINRTPNPFLEERGEDKGCCVLESLYPLCINQNTNVDWITLTGIHLSRTDFEFIIGMLSKKTCHLRAIDLSSCQLNTWNLQLLMRELPTQSNTLEAIDISNNPAQISPEIAFPLAFMECKSMKWVNLSQLQVTNEPVSLIPIQVLSAWRLEELRMTKTKINEETLDTLIRYGSTSPKPFSNSTFRYLESNSSTPLKALYLDGCQLTAYGIKRLCASSSKNTRDRKLHIDVSGNRIDNIQPIVEAIRQNNTPPSFAIRGLEFEEEEDLDSFINSIQNNTSTTTLDISEIQIEFRIDDDLSRQLKTMFSKNIALKTLDISGEDSRLETSSFGSAFFEALQGLKENSTLEILKIRNQKLGLQGATVLADVIRSNNTLLEIHCENNKIPLSGLVILNEALTNNTTITYLPNFEESKQAALETIQSVINDNSEPSSPILSSKPHLSIKPKDLFGKLGRTPKEKEPAIPDFAEAHEIVSQKWNIQQHMLKHYLGRNQQIALGSHFDETPIEDSSFHE